VFSQFFKKKNLSISQFWQQSVLQKKKKDEPYYYSAVAARPNQLLFRFQLKQYEVCVKDISTFEILLSIC